MEFRCFMFMGDSSRPKLALDVEAASPAQAAYNFVDDLFPGGYLVGPLTQEADVIIDTWEKDLKWSVLTNIENKRLYIARRVRNDH